MTYGSAFVAVLGVACLAIGIMIGVLIMVCYKKLVCCVLSDSLPYVQQQQQQQQQQHDRRISGISLAGIQSISGNVLSGHAGSTMAARHVMTQAAGLNHVDTQSVEPIGGSSRGQTFVTDDRALVGSTPQFQTRNDQRHFNDINRTRLQSSNRTTTSGSKSSVRSRKVSEQEIQFFTVDNIPTQPSNSNKEEHKNPITTSQSLQNYQRVLPKGNNITTPIYLPSTSVGSAKDYFDRNSTGSDLEKTFPKTFLKYPDDIKSIFEPCESSRTITLREKKLVYICKKMDDMGGLLELENMGISLFVPPYAIPYKQHNLITLVLNWDLSDNPYMEAKEALVSPVVYCGPHGSHFDKPCILKFRHCAHDTRFLRILSSETDLFEAKNWQDMDKIEEPRKEGIAADKFDDEDCTSLQSGVNFNVDECQVEVSHFSLFTGIMRSKHRLLKKWIQIAVFTHAIGPEFRHQEIRVYFLNKTPCALQWAIQNEASYNFSLACPDTTFLFMESGNDMNIHLSYLSDGWELVANEGEDTMRTVFFEQIWHGACPHTFMCFRKIDKRKLSLVRAETDTGSQYHNVAIETGDPELPNTSDLYVDNTTNDECSEINIALRLNQEQCENLRVPLNILMHNIKLKVSDTQVKVIDEGVCW